MFLWCFFFTLVSVSINFLENGVLGGSCLLHLKEEKEKKKKNDSKKGKGMEEKEKIERVLDTLKKKRWSNWTSKTTYAIINFDYLYRKSSNIFTFLFHFKIHPHSHIQNLLIRLILNSLTSKPQSINIIVFDIY